ncbi:MAG: hypothetical protein HPY76_03595 [Anaerolineae bacterium]|jgi:hypothetical protein|nr:hypothetical protein [Anaerolineae bacterium]
MPPKNLPEEKKIVVFLEKMNALDDKRQTWIDQVRAEGMSEPIAEEIQAAITGLEDSGVNRTRYMVEFAKLVKQWRLAAGAKQFRKH